MPLLLLTRKRIDAGLDWLAIKSLPANRRYAMEHKIPKGEMIMGYGYIDTVMPDGRLVNRDDLDAAFPDNPVRIDHVSMHGAVMNSLALKKYGISAETKTPPGGVIVRKPGTEEPWGLVMETAFLPVMEAGCHFHMFEVRSRRPLPPESTLDIVPSFLSAEVAARSSGVRRRHGEHAISNEETGWNVQGSVHTETLRKLLRAPAHVKMRRAGCCGLGLPPAWWWPSRSATGFCAVGCQSSYRGKPGRKG